MQWDKINMIIISFSCNCAIAVGCSVGFNFFFADVTHNKEWKGVIIMPWYHQRPTRVRGTHNEINYTTMMMIIVITFVLILSICFLVSNFFSSFYSLLFFISSETWHSFFHASFSLLINSKEQWIWCVDFKSFLC